MRHRLFERRVGLTCILISYLAEASQPYRRTLMALCMLVSWITLEAVARKGSHREGGSATRHPGHGLISPYIPHMGPSYPSSMPPDHSLERRVFCVVCVKTVVLLFWLCIVCLVCSAHLLSQTHWQVVEHNPEHLRQWPYYVRHRVKTSAGTARIRTPDSWTVRDSNT